MVIPLQRAAICNVLRYYGRARCGLVIANRRNAIVADVKPVRMKTNTEAPAPQYAMPTNEKAPELSRSLPSETVNAP
jgi:hypothetical protein